MDPLGHFGFSGIVGHYPEYPGHQTTDPFLAVERVTDPVFYAGICFGINPGICLGKTSPRAFLALRLRSGLVVSKVEPLGACVFELTHWNKRCLAAKKTS